MTSTFSSIIVGIVNPSTKLGNNFITYNSASLYGEVRESYPRKKNLRSYMMKSASDRCRRREDIKKFVCFWCQKQTNFHKCFIEMINPIRTCSFLSSFFFSHFMCYQLLQFVFRKQVLIFCNTNRLVYILKRQFNFKVVFFG